MGKDPVGWLYGVSGFDFALLCLLPLGVQPFLMSSLYGLADPY